MKTYLCIYFGSGLLVQLVTPVVARIARTFGIIDSPGARKVHSAPIPRIGGVAIMTGVMALMIPVLMLNNTIGQAFREVRMQVTVLLGTGFFVFVIGLLDDARSIPARLKLLSLVAASVLLCSTGARIEFITLESNFTVHLGWLSWPITVLWITGITVAMNFIDGLDGLAAGIAAIVCGTIAVIAFTSGQIVMGVLMLSLLGSLTGFLFFNWNPAKIFMGDCGSMFLGFMIGAGSVVCQAKTSALVGVALPALALGVPLLDAAFTFIRRKILDRRSIFSAERGHIHHRLLDMGLNQRHVVILMYAVTLAVAGIGMLMFVTRDTGAIAVIACGILVLLLVFRIAGTARLRETLAALHRNSAIANQAKEERAHFEDAQLQMRRVASFDSWWESLCTMAENMGFDRLALVHKSDASTTNMFVWHRTHAELRPDETVNMIIPLGAHGVAGATAIELALRKGESLESIGRRVSLFGRLIDEHMPDAIPAQQQRQPARHDLRSEFSPIHKDGANDLAPSAKPKRITHPRQD